MILDSRHIGSLNDGRLRALVRNLQQFMSRLSLLDWSVELYKEGIRLSWKIVSKELKGHMEQRTFVLLRLTEELERLDVAKYRSRVYCHRLVHMSFWSFNSLDTLEYKTRRKTSEGENGWNTIIWPY